LSNLFGFLRNLHTIATAGRQQKKLKRV
jgi:hypothetical protein